MSLQRIDLKDQPTVLQEFFQNVHDQPVIVEQNGTTLCIIYPTARLTYPVSGQRDDAKGSWDLPLDVAKSIAGDTD